MILKDTFLLAGRALAEAKVENYQYDVDIITKHSEVVPWKLF